MKKLILTIINEKGEKTETFYKSLKEIEKAYPQIAYHNLREIYLHSSGKKQRKLHNFNLKLIEKMSIKDAEFPSIVF
jgi:hypothetical protein